MFMGRNKMIYPFRDKDDIIALENEFPLNKAWKDKTVYQFLCGSRDEFPNNDAISFQLKSGPKDKATTLNFSELTRRVTQAANLFRSLGIGEDDVVAFLLPSTHETVITMLGGMTAGIVAPINPTLEPKQIAALLRESGAKVLVTLKTFPKSEVAQLSTEAVAEAPNVETVIEIDFVQHLSPPQKWIAPLLRPKNLVKHSAKIIDFDQSLNLQNADSLDFEENLNDRICSYFHTGGTTGMPKIAQHRHSGMLYHAWMGKVLLFTDNDTVLCPLPLFHVFASYPILAGCIGSGAHLVLPTPAGYRGEGVFDNFWQLVERWKATFIAVVPTAAAALLQRPIGDTDISSIRGAFCGSAPLPVELFKRFEDVTGVEISEGYGMTETTCMIAINPLDGLRKVGSVGIPLPFSKIRILDCDKKGKIKREMDVDEIGEICVANPGVLIGNTYTNQQKNIGLFADKEYLRTGDLGRIDADGYLWITGRAKDLIIRGGHNIDPALIEEALAGHPAVSFAGAIGEMNAKSGEVPCAYVELNKDASVTVDELIEHCKKNVHERAARPKYIEIMAELPKTAVGKIFKPALRKMAIKRIYNQALDEAGLGVQVSQVVEDKKRGLVACLDKIDPDISDKAVTDILGEFIRPWQWSK